MDTSKKCKNIPHEAQFWQMQHFEHSEPKSVNLASVGDCTKILETVRCLVYLINTLER